MRKVNPLTYGNKHIIEWASLILLFTFSVIFNNPENFDDHATEEQFFLPSKDIVSTISLGFGNFSSSLYWIKTISYFGSHSSNSNFNTLAQLLEIVTSLNPKAEHAYYMAAAVLPWNTGSTTLSDPILEKAMENFPDDWRWPYYRGFNHYWFEHNTKLAAYYLGIATLSSNCPPIVTSLALRMNSESGSLDTALIFLDNLLNEKNDRNIQKQLLQKRNMILSEKILRKVDRLLEQLSIRHYDSRDIDSLRKQGMIIPRTLPDGGSIHFNDEGIIVSSVSKKRFRIFIPAKKMGGSQ